MKTVNWLLSYIAGWLERRRSSEAAVLILLSILVGLGSGAGVWLFKQIINLLQHFTFGVLGSLLAPLGQWAIVLPTIAGALLVGWILRHWVGPERHHGVAGIMESVGLSGGRLPYQRIPAKALASALSIGVGASVGPEDPSVQIGANLGSMIGQIMRLSDDRVRSLVAAGAAGGIAAAFNAPIAGIFFALEIILGELSRAALSMVVLSAVISAIFTQAVSGPEPAFHVPPYPYYSVWNLPLYLALGLLAGLVAALYIHLIYAMRDIFHALAVPDWFKQAITGATVGIVGLFLPQVLGVGYDSIGLIFSGSVFPVMLLLVLLVAKLFLTPLSLAGGFTGGVFAPSLFLGAALGGAFGLAARSTLPMLQIAPQAFAMVGMAAVLAGTVRAPLTAILLLFEMTNDYRIILPLMFAVVISMLVSERLQSESVYTLSLLRQGIRLDRGRDVEVLEGLTVGETMSRTLNTLHTNDPLTHALNVFTSTHSHGLPALNEQGELVGIFTLQDLETAQKNDIDLAGHTVGEFCVRQLIVAYPDETLAAALRRMSINDIGRLPVVENGEPLHLVGILHRADIIRAYQIALSRRAVHRHRAQQVRLNTLSQLTVEEAYVEPGSCLLEHTISEIHWPQDVIVASIRRGGQVLIPHGNTPIQPGDVLVFLVKTEEEGWQVRNLCKKETV